MESNIYHAFYRGKKIEIKSDTTYHAQQKAKDIFRARNGWEITIVLVSKESTPVIHSTAEIG